MGKFIVKLFTIIFLLICSPAWAVDYPADANCQGAWLFTEGSGTSVADSSQNTNTGSFKGDGEPAWDTDLPAAYTDYSVKFDGSDDEISIGNDSSLDITGDFSIVFWFKPNSDYTSKQIIYERLWWNSGSDNAGFFISFGDTDKKIQFCAYLDGYSGFVNDTFLESDIWRHVAVVYDSDTNTGTIYINASADGTAGSLNTPDSHTETAYLGEENGSAFPFNGWLTEVAVFDRELTSTEITDIKDNGLGEAAAADTALFFGVNF